MFVWGPKCSPGPTSGGGFGPALQISQEPLAEARARLPFWEAAAPAVSKILADGCTPCLVNISDKHISHLRYIKPTNIF